MAGTRTLLRTLVHHSPSIDLTRTLSHVSTKTRPAPQRITKPCLTLTSHLLKRSEPASNIAIARLRAHFTVGARARHDWPKDDGHSSKSWRTTKAIIYKHRKLFVSTNTASICIGIGIGIAGLIVYQKIISSRQDADRWEHETPLPLTQPDDNEGLDERGLKLYGICLQKGLDEVQVHNIADKITPYLLTELAKSDLEEAATLLRSDEPLIRVPRSIEGRDQVILWVELPPTLAFRLLSMVVQQHWEVESFEPMRRWAEPF